MLILGETLSMKVKLSPPDPSYIVRWDWNQDDEEYDVFWSRNEIIERVKILYVLQNEFCRRICFLCFTTYRLLESSS